MINKMIGKKLYKTNNLCCLLLSVLTVSMLTPLSFASDSWGEEPESTDGTANNQPNNTSQGDSSTTQTLDNPAAFPAPQNTSANPINNQAPQVTQIDNPLNTVAPVTPDNTIKSISKQDVSSQINNTVKQILDKFSTTPTPQTTSINAANNQSTPATQTNTPSNTVIPAASDNTTKVSTSKQDAPPQVNNTIKQILDKFSTTPTPQTTSINAANNPSTPATQTNPPINTVAPVAPNNTTKVSTSKQDVPPQVNNTIKQILDKFSTAPTPQTTSIKDTNGNVINNAGISVGGTTGIPNSTLNTDTNASNLNAIHNQTTPVTQTTPSLTTVAPIVSDKTAKVSTSQQSIPSQVNSTLLQAFDKFPPAASTSQVNSINTTNNTGTVNSLSNTINSTDSSARDTAVSHSTAVYNQATPATQTNSSLNTMAPTANTIKSTSSDKQGETPVSNTSNNPTSASRSNTTASDTVDSHLNAESTSPSTSVLDTQSIKPAKLSDDINSAASGTTDSHSNESKTNKSLAIKEYNQAVQAHLSGKLDEAIAAYTKALEANDQLAEAYSNLGLIYNQQHNYAKAMTEFRKALAINPRDAITYNGLGATLRAERDFNGAIKNWQTAISLDPKLATAHYNLGTVYEMKKNYNSAIEAYKAAVKNDYRLGEAYYRMGIIMEHQHNMKEAMTNFKEALKISNTSEYSHDVKIRLAYLEGRLQKR